VNLGPRIPKERPPIQPDIKTGQTMRTSANITIHQQQQPPASESRNSLCTEAVRQCRSIAWLAHLYLTRKLAGDPIGTPGWCGVLPLIVRQLAHLAAIGAHDE
jgi:hypothetical protein